MNTTKLMAHKILIIEDDQSLLRLVSERFINDDFDVIKAADGEEGLRKALTEKPDVILLDLILPKVDGISVLKQLRADPWGANANIIVLSNLFSAEHDGEAINANVAAYLLKTEWHPDDLVTKVKEVLGIA